MSANVLALHPQGGVLLVLVRAAATGSLLSLFGSMLFVVLIVPPALAGVLPEVSGTINGSLRSVGRYSALAAIGTLGIWLVAQSANLAQPDGAAALIRAVGTVLSRTHFGHVTAAQILAAVAAACLLVRRRSAAAAIGALAASMLAVLLQVGHGHAYAMGSSRLMVADSAHLLAAGGWLGALVPLLIVARTASEEVAFRVAQRFSVLGRICVLLLALSAAWQGTVLVGSLAGLVGTAYGWVALAKLGLFGLLLLFACLNHYRFVPALQRRQPYGSQQALVRSIALETGTGVFVVIAAALLAQMEPAMHLQPWWPFSQRISFAPLIEDADIFKEVLIAALAVIASMGLLAAALLARRKRPAVAAASAVAVVVVWARPHLGVLLVPATSTSFYHSQTGFSAASIVRGQALFASNCTGCHGTRGAGDGPAARAISIPPADLTEAHLWMHSDGEMFWWLTHGIEAPDGSLAMPGFAGPIDDAGRWALIDYIRANNAGLAAHGSGTWPRPVQAPTLPIVCNGRSSTLEGERGRFVRLAFASPAPASGGGVEGCLASGATAADAYAIASGTPAPQIGGMEFLIDSQGSLRAAHRRGAPDGWDDPAKLAPLVARLRTHPAKAATGMTMDMPPGMKM